MRKIRILMTATLILTTGTSAAAKTLSAHTVEAVFIKTQTQTFNSRHYYLLQDGRIWIKPNRETTGKDEPWRLMGCEGLPCQPDNADFVVPDAIREISADADELTALDNKDMFYVRTSAGEGFFSKDEWVMKHGFPKATMTLPENLKSRRGIVMGRRHSDVLWHEDQDNNVHHYGTMGTSSLYVLAPEGYEIWYTDNGLPADFSNQLCGPERGTVVAENLQASAGTLFVINQAGDMYTYMDDFDLNGGTSMFIDYTYQPQPFRADDKGSDYATHLTPWRLPGLDWQKHAAPPLSGQARLSTEITILQNGHGNAARELRVAGKNQQGEIGYWFKAIFEDKWSFKKAPLTIEGSHWIDPSAKAKRVPSQNVSYEGVMTSPDKKQTYALELLDFNLQCSPASLRLTADDFAIEFKLHTIDAWINLKRRDPGRDGTPRVMLGTLEVEPEQAEKLPKALQALVSQRFGVSVVATTDGVTLFNKKMGVLATLRRNQPLPSSLKTYNYNYNIPVATFTAALAQEDRELISHLMQPDLLIPDLQDYGLERASDLTDLIRLNQLLRGNYQRALELIYQAKVMSWQEAVGSALLRNLLLGIGAPYWIPYANAITRTAPELLWSYHSIDDSLNDSAILLCRTRIRILDSRIAKYKQRQAEIEALRPRQSGETDQ